MSTYPIFDTHSHLYFPSCVKNLDSILKDCAQKNVQHQVQIGCDEFSSLVALNMVKDHPSFYCTLGLHPSDVRRVGIKNKEYHRSSGMENYVLKAKNFNELFALFTQIFEENKNKIVGFGETGFDLFHENSEEIFNLQKESFIHHLNLCERFDRPFILHSRNAKQATLEVLQDAFSKRKNLRGVWHCFSEDTEVAKIATQKYGLFLGIGGILTYNNTDVIRQAVKETPIEFLVTETDAPFLVPRKAKNRKIRTNSAALLPEVIALIAELKNMDESACVEILFQNAKRLFRV